MNGALLLYLILGIHSSEVKRLTSTDKVMVEYVVKLNTGIWNTL